MALFDVWCNLDETKTNRKRLWRLTEREGAREGIQAQLTDTMRSHYGCLERIAEDVDQLGYALDMRLGTDAALALMVNILRRCESAARIPLR